MKKSKNKVKKNTKDKKKNPFSSKKKLITVSVIIGILFLVSILSYGWYSLVYQNKIYTNISIGNIDFSGLSKENAQSLLRSKIKDIENEDIGISILDKTWDFGVKDMNINYDVENTVDKMYSIGRSNSFMDNVKTRISLLFNPKDIDAIYSIDQSKINDKFSEIYSDNESPVSDAKFVYSDGLVEIKSEKSGKKIDKARLYRDLDNYLSNLEKNISIKLELEDTYPKITKNMLEELEDQYLRVLRDNIILNSERKNITIDKSQISSWIYTVAVYENNTKTGLLPRAHAEESDENFIAQLEINQEEIRKFVREISKDINQDPKDARLSFTGDSVSVFQSPEKGYSLDEDQTIADVTDLLISRMKVAGITSDNTTEENNTIELPLEVTEPEVSDQNIDSLGIKEKISSGSTTFTGSPSNRIFNITHGAEQFNGVIIKPGETLSAISIIGNPSAETGYLPELVIKDNKTLPEYGGGLCQVSTTLFRAALNAGLEIVERENHIYRVSYYEPPVGMDATIYYPKPDLIIKNNTPAHILVQASVVGTKITFDMYGTKDSREVSISDPSVYDTISPPKDKYIESPDLPVGTIKKQESSHAGAKASFHYKVTKDGQTLTEQTFNSVYKAWQGIYLFGSGTDLPDGADATDKDGNKYEGKKDDGGNPCEDECEEGWEECVEGGIRRCNKDGQCLKWSAVSSCGDGKTCSGNQCVDE